MRAGEFYQSLLERGFTVKAKDNALYVAPRASLTDEDSEKIKLVKADLLLWVRIYRASVRTEEDEYGPRLTMRMPDTLYVEVANHRRERFLAIKAGAIRETEEE